MTRAIHLYRPIFQKKGTRCVGLEKGPKISDVICERSHIRRIQSSASAREEPAPIKTVPTSVGESASNKTVPTSAREESANFLEQGISHHCNVGSSAEIKKYSEY